MTTIIGWVGAMPSLHGVDGLLVTAYAVSGSSRTRLGASSHAVLSELHRLP